MKNKFSITCLLAKNDNYTIEKSDEVFQEKSDLNMELFKDKLMRDIVDNGFEVYQDDDQDIVVTQDGLIIEIYSSFKWVGDKLIGFD